MKKILITLLLTLGFVFGRSQCININSATFSNPSGDNVTWSLSVSWTAVGQKHFKAYVRDGNDTLLNICSEINRAGTSSGTFIYDSIITPGGYTQLVASFQRFDGLCGSGIQCGPDTTIITTNPLSITFEQISAKNIGNKTLVTFKLGEVDNVNYLHFNFTLSSGFTKRHKIYFPSILKPNETWQVEIDNLTGLYTTKKLLK